ncbi:unnamed protein product, partial [marine sediment metagenome]
PKGSGGIGRLSAREVLREEDSWRKGLLFRAGCSRLLPVWGDEREKPYILGDPTFASKMPNGNYLIGGGFSQVVTEVDPDLNIVWEFGEFYVGGADLTHLNIPDRVEYIESRNSVLISDRSNNRILEVDYDTQAVVNNITAITSGPLGRTNAHYDIRHGHLFIADYDNHYVAEIDWNGVEYWNYGAYGVAGAALNRLNHPFGVDVGYLNVIITDRDNHRVLFVPRGAANVAYYYPALAMLNPSVDPGGERVGISTGRDLAVILGTSSGAYIENLWEKSTY